jgi:hypothetical protein
LRSSMDEPVNCAFSSVTGAGDAFMSPNKACVRGTAMH